MNGTLAQALEWLDFARDAAKGVAVEVAVFPPFPWLRELVTMNGTSGHPVAIGAQACHPAASGAHTGGVSAAMLAEVGCLYVLCGHSETRREQRLADDAVGAAALRAVEAGLVPIVCVGETEPERDAGKAREVLLRQCEAGLASLPPDRPRIEVAYEPVWAIGTGRSASPEQAEEAHGWLRAALDRAGFPRARILYGGSVTHGNVAGFLSRPGVDGVLVGGQSLDPKAFRAIVAAADGIGAARRPENPGRGARA
jgi:triosephosphate isomerase